MKIKTAILAFTLLPAQASAMTGAELMASKNAFNIGYVYGVVETRVVVKHSDDPSQARIAECVNNANVTPNTIYDLTVDYLKRNPSFVPVPAVAAIMNTLAAMCP